jgi:hypothetical protein
MNADAASRLKSAKATLLDLEERRNANLSLHRYTGKAKYERTAFLLEDGISRARESVRRATREAGRG